jgi:hypothetical protein
MASPSTLVRPKLRYEDAAAPASQPAKQSPSPPSPHVPPVQRRHSQPIASGPSATVPSPDSLPDKTEHIDAPQSSSDPSLAVSSLATSTAADSSSEALLVPTSDVSHLMQDMTLSDSRAKCAITLAWWNGGRMSARSGASFQAKLLILERMVADTPTLSVIMLQEVFSNSAAGIAEHLRASTGDEAWTAVGCGSDLTESNPLHEHRHSFGMSCQAAVYNASVVGCLAYSYVESEETSGFTRAPLVLVLQRKTTITAPSRLLCIANLHISYREPRGELQLLPELLDAMLAGCVRTVRRVGARGLRRLDVTYALCGDFNRAAHSGDFATLRERKYIELVRQPRTRASRDKSQGGIGDGLLFLSDATTSGGKFLDNLWMEMSARRNVLVDAHVYGVWTHGKRLAESRSACAGRLRSERSDHSPVVATLCLEPLAADSSCAEEAPWSVAESFSVSIGSPTPN